MQIISKYWTERVQLDLPWEYLILPDTLDLDEGETGEYLVKLIKAWTGLGWETSNDSNVNLALEAVYADFEGDNTNLSKYVNIWRNEQKQKEKPDLKVMHVYSKQEQINKYVERQQKIHEDNFTG